MKNNKKKKIILGSCVGLALVSLCSVGFATWLVGMNKESAETNITNIQFDAVSSQTKYVDIAGVNEDTLTIVDSVTSNTYGTNNIVLEGDSKTDLNVALEKFELAYSKKGTSGTFKSLKLNASIDGVKTGLPAYTTATTDVFDRTAGINYYYIKLDKFSEKSTATYTETTITYDSTTKLESDFNANTEQPIEGFEYYKIKDTSKTLKFTWGNMFGGQAPIQYYQTKLNDAEDIETKLKMLNAIDQELTAMNEAFKNKTIKITVTLDVTFTTPVQ